MEKAEGRSRAGMHQPLVLNLQRAAPACLAFCLAFMSGSLLMRHLVLRSTFRCASLQESVLPFLFLFLPANAPRDATYGEPRCWFVALPVPSVWLSFHFFHSTSFCSCLKHPIYGIVQRCAHFCHFAEMFTLRRRCFVHITHFALSLPCMLSFAGSQGISKHGHASSLESHMKASPSAPSHMPLPTQSLSMSRRVLDRMSIEQ